MREVLNTLMRRDLHLVDTEMTPYYQDVYDHVLRASDWTESLRDLVSTILETRITIQGNRLNEVMKKLTSWAAIIAIPTAITGFYGQNVPYPGFQQRGGFLSSIILIVTLYYSSTCVDLAVSAGWRGGSSHQDWGTDHFRPRSRRRSTQSEAVVPVSGGGTRRSAGVLCLPAGGDVAKCRPGAGGLRAPALPR